MLHNVFFEMNESFVILILIVTSKYIPKLTPSISISCFETFKEKLSSNVVFIMMDIVILFSLV